MRILIEPGTYNCLNLGDLAMLQVAVARLRQIAPSAALEVITDAPEALRRHCPGTQPLSATARRGWFEDQALMARGQRLVPAPVLSWLARGKRILRKRSPRLLHRLLGWTRPLNVRREELDTFLGALHTADCVVVCGQGFLTDHARTHALATLKLLDAALGRKIPCVMLGQGIGPLSDPEVLSLARKVLPRVDLLALREGVVSLPLSRSLGVVRTRLLVTGDEAIQLACGRQKPMAVHGLGVNLRVSASSGVDESYLPAIGAVLENFEAHQQQFIPLPIARDHGLADVRAIRKLLERFVDSDGGVALDTPQAVIAEAGKCRVVITGAYHAAVFALAQGVPTVCLAKSEYFRVKFEGLAAQFGEGCVVISLADPRLQEHLIQALAWAWDAAPRLETPLQKAAALQVLRSYRAYNRIARILRRNCPEAPIRTLRAPRFPAFEKPSFQVVSYR